MKRIFFKFNKIGIIIRHYNHQIIKLLYALKPKGIQYKTDLLRVI